MKTIAFDVMGNDNGVKAGVEAALAFVKQNSNYSIILVGDEPQINSFLVDSERIEVIHSPNVVDASMGARAARTGDNSMATAIKLVKEGKADAVISSGDSGIYLSMATLTLKRIEGVKRPAFMPIFPTISGDKKFVMLDVGANIDVNSEMLVQWAKLGSVFSKEVLGVETPRVGLLNVGTEDKKGKDFHSEAHAILKNEIKLNYVGFIESRNLLNHEVDVAVVDGYAGNFILKTMEGTVLSLMKVIKEEIKSKLKYKIGGLIAKGAFKQVGERLDYRNVGAAWIIGLSALAIKTHGSSDMKAYLGAFKQISIALDNDALDKLKGGLDG